MSPNVRELRPRPPETEKITINLAPADLKKEGSAFDLPMALGILAFGTTHFAVEESRAQLAAEADLKTSYLRLRAYPFTDDVAEFIHQCDRVYVVEQNRDGQMQALMRLELDGPAIAKLRGILHYNGLPIDARSISDGILVREGRAPAARSRSLVSAGMAAGGE